MIIQGSFYEKTTLIEAIIKVLCVLSKSVRNIEPCILRNAENFTALLCILFVGCDKHIGLHDCWNIFTRYYGLPYKIEYKLSF